MATTLMRSMQITARRMPTRLIVPALTLLLLAAGCGAIESPGSEPVEAEAFQPVQTLNQLTYDPASTASAWPEFRGPAWDGHAPESSTPPVHWSETENVTWKTRLPHLGWSTPAIMNGQIWLTTATEDGHDFYGLCVNAETGVIEFYQRLFHADNPEPLGNSVNRYASPSPVVEPGRVYLNFGSYGTACLNTETGEVLWSRVDLPCRHYRGPGSSPIVFEDLLVLTMDGVDQQYLVALDKFTGETRWRTDRSTVWNDLDANGEPRREGDFRKGFSTPIVYEIDGAPQLLSPGSTTLFAYDPRTGREIWSIRHTGHTPAPRPVFSNGLVFSTTGQGRPDLLAVRANGRGDVTDTHLAWSLGGAIAPNMPSPILVDELLYLVSDRGLVTCIEPATGREIWTERIGGNHIASPVYAGGQLYFSDTHGTTTVMNPGRTPRIVAQNELDEGFHASPAVSGNALFLRTKTHLYRIETTSPEN